MASGDYEGQVVLYEPIVWSGLFGAMKAKLCGELDGVGITQSQWLAYVPDQPYQKVCS